MYKILTKNYLVPKVCKLEIAAEQIAQKALPGQFVMLRLGSGGERIPLTIAGSDKTKGIITLIVQDIGKTTSCLSSLNTGDSIADIVGPLGHPTEIKKYGHVLAVAGGVGNAEVLPVVRALKDAGNVVTVITGARSKDIFILIDELTNTSDKIILTTDDGSSGKKGLVTDSIKELLDSGNIPDIVYAIGPVPMMRAVSELTKPRGIRTLVSLNPIMLDGTGMCGSCRVTVAGDTKFACVDGPEFDGHLVDWNELSARLALFKNEEKTALEKNHKCRIS
jgi:NAD(P)H-flavin reductase